MSAPPAAAAIDLVTGFTYDLVSADVPPATRDRLLLLLLDTIGVAAAARDLAAAEAARGVAYELFGSDRSDAVRMIFDGRRVSAPGAVFALATQIDNLDAHDGYAPSKGHIGVVVVPALLAHAQRGDAVMAEAVLALAAGYEIAARAGLALHATAAEYHASGSWNALGVAAVAARLDGLARPLLREALGIAEYHGPRSQMMRGIDWPSMVHDAAGWGGLAGSIAVTLAGHEFTGAPAITVEDPAVRAKWSDLGTRWAIDEHYVKTHPVCRWAHPMIDAALAIRAEHSLRAADIGHVEIATFEEGTHLFRGVPSSTAVAQYSSSFPVAAAFVRGRVGVAEISGDGLLDPEAARIVGVTTVERCAEYDERFPAERLAQVTVTTLGGQRLTSGTLVAAGSIADPDAPTLVRSKFHDLADPVLGRARTDAIERFVLDHDPADMAGDLIELLVAR